MFRIFIELDLQFLSSFSFFFFFLLRGGGVAVGGREHIIKWEVCIYPILFLPHLSNGCCRECLDVSVCFTYKRLIEIQLVSNFSFCWMGW